MSLNDNIRTASNGRQCDCWHMAAIALLFWDHLLTLKTEIRFLWKKPSGWSGYLFIIHRYFNPITIIFTFVTLFGDLPVSCQALSNIREGILIIAQLIVTLIMTQRIYALYGCNKRLLFSLYAIIVVLLTIAVIFTFTAGSSTDTQASLPSGGCSTDFDAHDASRAAIAWLMIFIYDVLLFGLAVYSAFKTRQELKMIRTSKFKASLRVILLRDGAMYFGVMTVINLANILSFYLLSDCMRGGLAPFTSSLSVTLVSRLMLNLHQAWDTGIYLCGSQAANQVEKTLTQIAFNERNNDDLDA